LVIVAADGFTYGKLVYSVALDSCLAVRDLVGLFAAEIGSDCPAGRICPAFALYSLVVGDFVPLHPGIAAPRAGDYRADA
jgi:hypothetical protein